MTKTSEAFIRDANNVPITANGLTVSKTMTFDGATTNDPGDFDGTGNPATLFTITGEVALNVFAICTTDLTGASATVEVGTATSTAALCNQVTATNVDDHESWHDANQGVGINVAGHWHIVDEDVIQTVGTANITGGVLQYYCWWVPLSADGKVVAA